MVMQQVYSAYLPEYKGCGSDKSIAGISSVTIVITCEEPTTNDSEPPDTVFKMPLSLEETDCVFASIAWKAVWLVVATLTADQPDSFSVSLKSVVALPVLFVASDAGMLDGIIAG